jgi:hypothetical protein
VSTPIPDDLHRVYRNEWVIVHVVVASPTGAEECRRHFDETYRGRVRDDEVRFVGEGAGLYRVDQLQLKLPNLKGEFKHLPDAVRFAEEHCQPRYSIVNKNSKADHELRNYGVKMLPREPGPGEPASPVP